ncbi:MAG: site-specific integrase [bacterium]|nr:site-specific integrase [bacterium]
MASIRPRTTPAGHRRWEVVYRGPDKRQRTKTFKRKTDAQRYANTVEADLLRHDWVDPQRGRQPFREWAERWSATTTHLKPKTRESYESIVRNHLLPEFGHRPIASIDHAEVLAYLSGLTNQGKGAGTVRNIRDVMRLVFKLAIRNGVVKTNPVEDIKAPRKAKKEMLFLTEDQVLALAEEIQDPPPLQRGASHREGGYPDYAILVLFAAYTGLRAGEIGALRVSRINLMRRRVEVSESADEAHGGFNVGPTKTYSTRSVGLPAPIADILTPYLAGKKQNDLVFEGPDGGPLRHSNWYPRHFKPAVTRAGLPRNTRFHDLRHTYAAFLIAEGAHPRAIMERMGHSTINVTLGTYGHLFPAIDEQLDDALAQRFAGAAPRGSRVVQLDHP